MGSQKSGDTVTFVNKGRVQGAVATWVKTGENPAAARRAGGKRGGMQGHYVAALDGLFPSGYATRLMRIGSSRDTHPQTGQNRGTSRPHLALTWHYGVDPVSMDT